MVYVTNEGVIDSAKKMLDHLSHLRDEAWEEMWDPHYEGASDERKMVLNALRAAVREARQMDREIEAIQVALYLRGEGLDLGPHIENIRAGEHRVKSEGV